MNKLIFVTLVLACTVAVAQSGIFKGFADDSIYEAIQVILKNQYPNEPEKVECLMTDFRSNKVADKFYSADLLFDQDKLSREIQPYIDEANSKCSPNWFSKTWKRLFSK